MIFLVLLVWTSISAASPFKGSGYPLLFRHEKTREATLKDQDSLETLFSGDPGTTPELSAYLDQPESSLFSSVRVLCWVMTEPQNHETKARHVKDTWGRSCNKLVFMSSKEDPSLPAVSLQAEEGRDNLKQAHLYLYKNHFDDANWFLKADDDTYVAVENLRYMLQAHNHTDPVYFDFKFKTHMKKDYMSGEAGYVLSKEALGRLATKGLATECRSGSGGAEDVEMEKCMERIGVDARDSRGLHLMPGITQDLSNKVANFSLLRQEQFCHMPPMYTNLDQSLVYKPIPIVTELYEEIEEEFNVLCTREIQIPSKDKRSPDLEIEVSSIDVLREEMIKGSGNDLHFANKSSVEESYTVPKTIHFVWTGKPILQKYIENIQTFAINKDYEIILWTDEKTLSFLQTPEGFKVKDINSVEFINTDAIKDETNPGAKSDIYRLEIVYQFGGIYTDTDSVCLKRFPEILQHSFVSHVFGGYNNIQNSVFGFPKHSAFLRFALDTLKRNWSRPGYKDRYIPVKTGPVFLTSMFVHNNDSNINMIHQDYLVLKSDKSITYQTMDGSWLSL